MDNDKDTNINNGLDRDALDMFGLANLDKIQEDIENEINFSPEFDDQSQNIPPTVDLDIEHDWKTLLEEADPLYPIAEASSDNQGNAFAGEFYRETIKNAGVKRSPSGAWFFKIAAVLIACTVGMGAMGFGIGIGFRTLFDNIVEDSEPEYVVDIEEQHHQGTATSVDITGMPSYAPSLEIQGDTLADIVELLKPSVVGITSHRSTGSRQGSGLIFAENDSQIFIVTNHYVVQGGGNSFDIVIEGNEPIVGRPAGSDSSAHLAVLSIYKSELAAAGINNIVIATFGDSDNMRVGDTVLALGNAMGYGTAVTRGIISAQEQTVVLPTGGHTLSLLQTDAAINYGNSGGPLINTRGEVIGINFDQASHLIFDRSTNVEGMSFSISSNIVAPILDELVSGQRPALGIMGGTISDSMAYQLGIPSIGVYVSSVLPDRAAYRGGMQESDIITGFNGMQVFNWAQLVYAIRFSTIGEEVEVRVLRNNEAITLYVELDVMVVDSF